MVDELQLTVRAVQARAVNVPMPLPLQTSGGTVDTAPLVLIDLLTDTGITGCAYLFCYTTLALKPVVQLIENLEPLLIGDRVEPRELERKLQRRFRLLGAKGVAGMAIAGIDMAAWDALAKAHGMPLARLLGGAPRPVPAYNSCGLGMIGSAGAANEAAQLTAPGFRAIKLRLGYPDLRTDLEVLRAVRREVGEDILVMVDYNQALSVAEAVVRAHALDAEGVYWIEEPTLADDFAGHARIRASAHTPIQIGENWWGPHDMATSVAAGASALAMPDAMKIGGVSGWIRAATLAEAAGLPLSSHLFPEVSAHLLAVSPTCHWLEFVDWANPILQESLAVIEGEALATDVPGTGIAWDEAAVARYLVS